MRKLVEGIKYQRVTCENQHEIAIIPIDRIAGFYAEDLTHPKLQDFKNGDTLIACPDCSSRVLKYEALSS